MKTIDYLKSLPNGEVVGKRGLALFKRLGLIWDYSRFGYLEGLNIHGKKQEDDYLLLHISSNRMCKAAEPFQGAMHDKWRQKYAHCDKTKEELQSIFAPKNEFVYADITFHLKYLDGCFSPYLVKTSGGDNTSTVNRRMAFPQGVI